MEGSQARGGSGWIGLTPPEEALRLSGLEFLNGMMAGVYPAPPFTETTGIQLVSVAHGHAVFHAVPSVRFYNPMAVVHGGWISFVLDTAMGCAVHTTLAAGQTCATVDMTITFVKPIREEMGTLRCEGNLLHAGSRIASAEGKVYDSQGRLIAHGTETCIITQVVGR